MKLRYAAFLAAFASLTLSACSTKVATPAAPTVEHTSSSTPKGASRQNTVTIRATVQKVDQSARKVTLKGFDGTTETITVGPEVRNLAQVRKGDEVVVTYYQSAAFEVLKKGDKRPAATTSEGVARAEPGQQPGAIGAQVITMVAEVVRLDRDNSTASLKGPEGNIVSVDVQNPANFDKVKVGDKVEITLTEAMAIDVAPAGAN